ncbi:hypothetical protein L1049_022557 [Liquidambar formosana]|uniref:Plastid lipid-associated protein/fibrillin conserved domain-containing protein n=1 Tax=Liquidambar formosana TaxID=63359 RepID=A0AAP0RCM3_LIQFO
MSALLLTSHPSFLYKNPNYTSLRFCSLPPLNPSISFTQFSRNTRFSSFRFYSTFSGNIPDPDTDPPSGKTPATANDQSDKNPLTESSGESVDDGSPTGIVDEWGEKAEPEPETSYSKLADADPPKNEDEWGGDEGVGDVYIGSGNGSAAAPAVAEVDKFGELKRCLVDTVYGTNLGFGASSEVRAEALELVNQLEAVNPTPAPTEAAGLLEGNWVLLYTAFSELLPLLAVGATPFLKVKGISQAIDTTTSTIVNSTTLSSPFATFSFSASAAFEVRSPSRIQVEFKEGTLQPPEIKSSINLPENVDVFGQKINLLPVQQSLDPLQEAVANISRAISGQPPLKVPIPGDRTKSWLLITYLDEDFRISRGDGGLFVLAKEGSPLLDQ